MRYIFIGDLAPYQSGAYSERLARLQEECERYFTMELPEAHPKKSTTYMGIAMVNLSLLYLLSRDRRYLAEAVRWMDAVCGYPQWGNAHMVNLDLSASWILFGLSLSMSWLEDALSEEQNALYRDTVREHADIILEYAQTHMDKGWATEYWQNHNWINMTGLAAAGYALSEDRFTAAARENFARVFSGLAEDGSNYEGTVYWRYGGMWLFVYAWLLRQQEGLDYFENTPYLENTFWYRLYQSAPDLKRHVGFGDCHDRYSSHTACVYYLVARQYGNGYAQTLGDMVTEEFLQEEAARSKVKPGILPEACFELLWYDPAVEKQPLDALPRSRVFPDLGLVCLRSGWDDQATVLSFKCGYPGGARQWTQGWALTRETGAQCLSLSHHHPDNLAYVLIKGDDYFTCEDGYNRDILPSHHSVPVIDGRQCDAQGVNDVYMQSIRLRLRDDPAAYADYDGTMDCLLAQDGLLVFSAESKGTYSRALAMQSVRRTYVTDDALSFVLLIDSLVSETPHTYQMVCNTDRQLEVYGDSRNVDARTGISYTVLSDLPIQRRRFLQHVESVMTTQEPDNKCTVTMHTTAYESVSPQTAQVFAELFAFAGAPCEAAVSGDTVRLTGARQLEIILSQDKAPVMLREWKKGQWEEHALL